MEFFFFVVDEYKLILLRELEKIKSIFKKKRIKK